MSLLDNLRKRFRPAGFCLPRETFGWEDTERCIEIPWAFSCYQGEKRVLDVGYANAEERYLSGLLSLKVPQLYGLDMITKDIEGIIPVQGDVRNTNFPEGFFDLVLCISTIEHVGRDNSIYFRAKEQIDDLGDCKAIREISRITKRRGRIVLTVPFGKFHDYGWFIHYDKNRLEKLIKASGCKVLQQDYFIYMDGWRKCHRDALKDILYKDNNASAAAGLVCMLLEK